MVPRGIPSCTVIQLLAECHGRSAVLSKFNKGISQTINCFVKDIITVALFKKTELKRVLSRSPCWALGSSGN